MRLDVQRVGLGRPEHGIAPPMRSAITLPVKATLGAWQAEAVVYVSLPAFGPRTAGDEDLVAIAREIAARLSEERP